MVGRDRELAILTDAWRKAVDERTPHLVTLVAPAGVGKSRLVREFIERVRADGGRALVGRCLSYGEGITYWPVRELVHQAAGITEADDREAAGERITDLFAGRPDGTRLAARVATVVGLSAEPAPQEELFWAVRRLLEQVAADRPILVVLEDLHWAEDTLLDLVEYVVDLAANVPLLVLATARPDLIERRPTFVAPRQTATVIRLEPLGADAAGELLAALPGGAAVPTPSGRGSWMPRKARRCTSRSSSASSATTACSSRTARAGERPAPSTVWRCRSASRRCSPPGSRRCRSPNAGRATGIRHRPQLRGRGPRGART